MIDEELPVVKNRPASEVAQWRASKNMTVQVSPLGNLEMTTN